MDYLVSFKYIHQNKNTCYTREMPYRLVDKQKQEDDVRV